MKQKYDHRETQVGRLSSRQSRSSSVASVDPNSPSNQMNPSNDSSSSPKGNKVYTATELAQHNTEKSIWISVQNEVYDITKYLKSHPGGSDMILLSAGRDITDLLRSHHPFSEKPYAILKKYHIGTLERAEYPLYAPDTGFYKECREKVHQYFVDNNMSPQNGGPAIRRIIFFVLGFLASFFFAFHPSPLGISFTFYQRLGIALVFGWFQAIFLMHTLHDSLHCSLGQSTASWGFFGHLVTKLCGVSRESWYHQHTIGHHVFTNLSYVDPDLPATKTGDLRRLVHSQAWEWMYRLQWLYMIPLYGLLVLKFRLQDVVQVFSGKNGNIRVNPSFRKVLPIVLPKIVWAIVRIGVPLFSWGADRLTFAILFFVAELMSGYYLALNFQVSHISDIADYPIVDTKTNTLSDEWAISQVKTSVDYHHNSWRVAFLSGALNYQTVHHLFPTVSQYYYPEISPIVKEVCKKHNIQFNLLPTYSQAFQHHVKHLYNLGLEGKAVHID